MQTIICPVDFSACSENAAHFAAALGAEFGSRIVLLHAYESPVALGMEPSATAVLDKKVRVEAQRGLSSLKESLLTGHTNLKVDILLKEGRPSDEIGEAVVRENADLIIMGTTGKGKAKKVLIGSTSSKVVRNAVCQVMCVPKNVKYSGIRKIVYATDLKEDNLSAALSIVSFARKFNAEIVFVYIDEKHEVFTDEYIDDMTKKIRSHVKYNKMAGFITKSRNIADGIGYFLDKNDADLLVMFTHQRHFPATLTNPGMTTKVLEDVKIPILVLTANELI